MVEIADGVIVAVHDKAEPRAVDLGNVAILPGLVNAHTHLEFSDLTAPLKPTEPFADWIRVIVAHRRSRGGAVEGMIAQGLAEAVDTGTRVIGEIATEGWSPEVFLITPARKIDISPKRQRGNVPSLALRASEEHSRRGNKVSDPSAQVVVFRELLGLLPERIEEQLAIAKRHLQEATAEERPTLVRGLSPHAPYSVHPELFQQLAALCREYQAPLAMHLAETRAELELLSEGRGELVEMLSAFGAWRENIIPRRTRILDYLKPLADVERGLVVHGNYLADEDIAFLAEHPNLSVVYCPRTHAYFGHQNHPWPKLIEAGVRVALGTDSRGSNPDLNLWEEVKFLRRKHPNVPPVQWLTWATQNGAAALYGPKPNLGTLQVGHPAVFTTLPLADRDATDPYELLFS